MLGGVGVSGLSRVMVTRSPHFPVPLLSKFLSTSLGQCQEARSDLASKPKEMPRMTSEEFQQLYRQHKLEQQKEKTRTVANYSMSLGLIFLALAFGSVPFYRAICQRTGWGGTPMTDATKITPDKLIPVNTNKKIRISFTAETSSMLPWKFVPQQREVYLVPGETALAFYKAKNTSEKDIIGMATYSVTPDHVAPYFNKIQCFCFEEQKLNAGEEVDMPLFFFIDPDFASDPAMKNIDDIVLHYTFFKANYGDEKDSAVIPVATSAAKTSD